MTQYIKYLYVFIGFILVLVLLNFGINAWVTHKLPKLINQENTSDYKITYKDVAVSIWNTTIQIDSISVVPRTDIENTNKKVGIYASINRVEVNSFDIWSVLFGKKIKAKKLIVAQPKILLYKNDKAVINNYKSINSKVIAPFEKIIIVSNIYLNEGQVFIIENTNKKTIASTKNINLKIEGIVLNENTLKDKIPFAYQNYSLVCDSLFYHVNEFYDITSTKLVTTENLLQLENFKLQPLHSRKDFVRKIPKEKDLYTLFAKDITLNKMDWGFKEETFFFKTNSLVIQELDANIYRGKMPEDDLSKKKLYNSLLREVPFDLKVDTLKIEKSKLVYEEEKEFEKGSGKLMFTNFDMTVLNIQSGLHAAKVPDTQIAVNCTFMNNSNLKVDWSFNVQDKSDAFTIKGSIFNFNTEQIDYFTKPYLNVVVKGDLDKVFFNFSGNDTQCSGDFALKYDDLKIEVFRNNKRFKINKFVSAVANLFIKDDSGEELKSTTVQVERNQEKSFYNLLWISIADGLKQILL